MITLLGTVLAAIYIYYQMRLVMLRQTILLPTHLVQNGGVSDSSSVPTIECSLVRADENLRDRRPWLFRDNSYATNVSAPRSPSRARSLPGHMSEEELRDWMMDTASGRASPEEHDRKQNPISLLGGNPFDTPPSANTTSPVPSVYIEPDTYPPTPTIGGRPPPYRTESGYSHRATMSLDISRPMWGHEGGRAIADDSDLYAMSRGARRPEYGRMRGESGASLLGRPELEDRSGDSRLLSPGRREEVERYGRPRGESGAALLGRPNAEDAASVVSERSAL